MCIIIGADIVPTKSNIDIFCKGDKNELVGVELASILDAADYRIFNLEVPLTDKYETIDKEGPSLIAPTSCIEGYKALKTDLVTISNNHIMDQGVQGLRSTIEILDKAGIMHVGAGENLASARKPFFFTVKNKTYGIYACAEHEFSIAGEDCPGANPFEPLESLDHVKKMKEKCDYAIVLYHGGKEHYRYPSPYLQKICRKLIEKGSDLVVCQHSHCVGCKEEYLQGTIVYGQGNFLFDYQNNEYWNTSLLIKISDKGGIDYIPLMKDRNVVRQADRNTSDIIVRDFLGRSEEIKYLGGIEDKYKALAEINLSGYILCFLGINNNFFFRVLNRLSGQRLSRFITQRVLNKQRLGIRNYIECETHRELLLKGLEQK